MQDATTGRAVAAMGRRERRRLSLGSQALRRAVRERGLTLELAAAAVGVEAYTLFRWVHGMTRPSLGCAARIEDTFPEVSIRLWVGVDPDWGE